MQIMDRTGKGLDAVIHDALNNASIPPSLMIHLRDAITCFYAQHGVHDDDFGSAVSYIYDHKLREDHHIYEFSWKDYLILPAKMAFPRDVLIETLKAYKQDGKDLSSPESQQFIHDVTIAIKLIHEQLMSFRKQTRKFEKVTPLPDFPGYEELKRFHECERKTSYPTRLHAEEKIEPEQTSYQCRHCSNWHNGRPPTAFNLPEEVLERRYKRTWRRYKNV